jgi:molybdopterin-guanine dinucleotide biosynthesis protein A
MDDAGIAVVILAGGQATRFPGKLERPIGDVPLLVRTYRNLREAFPVYIAVNHAPDPSIGALLDAQIVFDRTPQRGPLAALLTALERVRESRAFVVAGDMPFVHSRTLSAMLESWQANDEAVIALDEVGDPQPLLAIYDRIAFIRTAAEVNMERDGVKDVLVRLRWRGVTLKDRSATFNINTEQQYYAALDRFTGAAAGA